MAGTMHQVLSTSHDPGLRHEIFEERRQLFLLYLGNALACMILMIFGAIAAAAHQTTLTVFTLAHAAVCAGTIGLLRWTGNLRLANRCFIYGILIQFTYLVVTGGMDNTGPLWAYPMVAAAIFLQGTRRGMLVAAVMFCIVLVAFFGTLPIAIPLASYAPDFKLRFIATFLVLALFTALHEYARIRNQKQLLHVSAQLDQLSHTDPLTALPNRRYMLSRLEIENARSLRQPRPYTILYGDVDHFKRINDRCGHHAGDLALHAIAQTLRRSVRQQDEVGRWGGEEFLILLLDTEQAQAIEIAEKLRAAVAATPFLHGSQSLHLTMSFGVHTIHCHGNIDDFIQCADQKLYFAKKCGRNRIVAHLDKDRPIIEDSEEGGYFAMAL